jgi:hypothetical protein
LKAQQAAFEWQMGPALPAGQLEVLGGRRLGQSDGYGASDQRRDHSVERVVGLDAGLAGAVGPAQSGRFRLEPLDQGRAGGCRLRALGCGVEARFVAFVLEAPEDQRRRA